MFRRTPPGLRHDTEMHENEPAWKFEHSIECDVSPEFAWSFWTTVSNWAFDADVDSIELFGPFAAGSNGVTHSKSSGRVEWRIAAAEPGRAVIEFPFPGAVGRFVWTFRDSGGHARITQLCTIEGEAGLPLAQAFGPMLEAGIPAGMQKLCENMERADRARRGS